MKLLLTASFLLLNQFMPKYIPKYQEGGSIEQSAPDYSTQGFVRMDELEGLFAARQANESPYAEEQSSGSGYEEDNSADELRMQNELLQETLSRMEEKQAYRDPDQADQDLDMFFGELGDNDNMPIDPDELFERYASRKNSQAYEDFSSTYSEVAGNRLRSDSAYNTAMMAGESSGGNMYAKNPNSSATGAYQFVKGTLKDVYNKTPKFKKLGSFEQFNKAYQNSGAIQEAVMNRYTDMGSSVHKNDPVAKALWHYGPKFAQMYMNGTLDLDKKPADYGVGKNTPNPSFRSYLKTHGFNQRYQEGGYIPTAYTEEEKYEGLNNPAYNEMFFDSTGVNMYRGLDNYHPVYLQDETGKSATLHGPQDTANFHGSVYEKKMQKGGMMKKKFVVAKKKR